MKNVSLSKRSHSRKLDLVALILIVIFVGSSCKMMPEKFPGMKVKKEKKEQVDADFQASINRIDESLASQKELKSSMDTRLGLLNEKFNNREIETQTYNKLKKKFESYKTGIDKTISTLETIKSEVQTYQANQPIKRRYYKEFEMNYKEYLTSMLKKAEEVNGLYLVYAEDLALYDDLLNSDLMEEFELSVFFPSGVYQLKEEDEDAAAAAFEPLVDKISAFVAKYPDVNLVIRVMTKGYADSQKINPDSNLGKKLAELTDAETKDSKELNKVLSGLRAIEISKFIYKLISNKNPGLLDENLYQINMEPIGMGEEFPNPNIADYTEDDKRRRIVSLFWDVLPKE